MRRKLNFTDLRNTTTSPAAGKEEEADSDVEEVPADHGKVRQITPLVGKHKKVIRMLSYFRLITRMC